MRRLLARLCLLCPLVSCSYLAEAAQWEVAIEKDFVDFCWEFFRHVQDHKPEISDSAEFSKVKGFVISEDDIQGSLEGCKLSEEKKNNIYAYLAAGYHNYDDSAMDLESRILLWLNDLLTRSTDTEENLIREFSKTFFNDHLKPCLLEVDACNSLSAESKWNFVFKNHLKKYHSLKQYDGFLYWYAPVFAKIFKR